MRQCFFAVLFCVATAAHYEAFAAESTAAPVVDTAPVTCSNRCCAVPRRTRTVTTTTMDACGSCRQVTTTRTRYYRRRLFSRRVRGCNSCN